MNDVLFCTPENGFKLSDVKTWKYDSDTEILVIEFFSGMLHKSQGFIAKNLLSFFHSQCTAIIRSDDEQDFVRYNHELQKSFRDFDEKFLNEFQS